MKNNKKLFLFFLLVYVCILLYIFRSMFFNLSNKLYSWLDVPYVIWLIYQGVEKITNFNFTEFGSTNIFYPLQNSYFFSDLLLPQAFLATPLTIFIDNPILVFNLLVILTFLLNYLSLYLFWSIWFKKPWQRFLASIVFIFSPFFHLQFGHFQMMSYWPFFLSLYFFIRNKNNKFKDLFFTAIFLIIQFLSSVYLSIFLIFTLLLKVFLNFIFDKKIKKIKEFFIVFLIFLIGASYFIFGYISINRDYNFSRNYGEFVTYSAHVSDYIFTNRIQSLLYNTQLFNTWNRYNGHFIGESASFPGCAMFSAFFLSLFSLNKKNNNTKLVIKLSQQKIFFLLLIIFGFVFSIGPRINFNGYYSGIPAPYALILKYIPFIDSIRALARWSFLVYIGFTYFFINFLKNKKNVVIIFFVAFFLIEMLPVNLLGTKEEYIDKSSDLILKEACSNKRKVLLEIPFNHLMVEGGAIKGLNYISKRQLASTYHNCYLVNGYSGYEPLDQVKYYNELNNSLIENNLEITINLLNERKISFIRINYDLIDKNLINEYTKSFSNLVTSGYLIKVKENLYLISR